MLAVFSVAWYKEGCLMPWSMEVIICTTVPKNKNQATPVNLTELDKAIKLDLSFKHLLRGSSISWLAK